jgi:hypothetical protein
MKNIILLAVVLAAHAVPAQAQQSRSRVGGGEAQPRPPVVLPDIPADRARPLVGVWEGTMTERTHDDVMPYVLVIEFLNGGYTGYSVNPGGVVPHMAEKATGRSFHWEQPNINEGTLVFDVTLSDKGTMTGTMKLVGASYEMPGATLSLRRRVAK